MECLICKISVRENRRFCDECLDKYNQKRRINYTLMKCWYCSGTNTTKLKKDGMCNVCKNHKSATKYKDNKIGIDPNHCYCCGEGVLVDLLICAYCSRSSCNSCGKIDEKQLITCMTCHPPKLGIKNGTMIKSIPDSIDFDGASIDQSVYIPNYIKWCMKANNVEFKNNYNKRRLDTNIDDSNKKQKKK